jgi:hypothetical protein
MRRPFPLLVVAIGFAGGAARAQTAPGAPGSNQAIPEKVAPPIAEPNGAPIRWDPAKSCFSTGPPVL